MLQKNTADFSRFTILIALCLPVMIACIDVMAVSVALNTIILDLKINFLKAQWLLSSYTMGTAAFLILIGKLADIYGRRKILALGILLFGISSILAAISKIIFLLITARFLQGVASAAMMTATIAIITHEFIPEERITVISHWATGLGLAMALGPLVGGLILHFFTWQMIFIINIPICFLSYYLIIRHLPESKNITDTEINWFQALCLTFFLLLLVSVLSEGESLGWQSSEIITYSILSISALFFYATSAFFSKNNLIDYTVFKSTNFAAASFCGFLSYFCMYAWLFIMSIYLQDTYHLNPLLDSIVCSAFSAAFAFGSKIFSIAITRIKHKWLMSIGFTLAAFSFLLMTRINIHTSLLHLIAMFSLLGFAIMLVNTPSMTLATRHVLLGKSGIASGLIFTIRWLGGTIGIVAITLTYHHFTEKTTLVMNKLPSFISLSTQGLSTSCLVLAGAALIGLMCTLTFIQTE